MCLECVGMNGTQRKLNGFADEGTIEQIPKEFEEVVSSSSNRVFIIKFSEHCTLGLHFLSKRSNIR